MSTGLICAGALLAMLAGTSVVSTAAGKRTDYSTCSVSIIRANGEPFFVPCHKMTPRGYYKNVWAAIGMDV